MRHLVTGGSGFIGHLVARRLRERGETVRVLDVWRDTSQRQDVEFVECSVLDRAGVRAAMRDVDVVHHGAALVAQTGAGHRFQAVNVDGSRIVAEEAARQRVRAIVHISSTAVYGLPPAGPITAATPLKPFEPYGRSKLAGEQVMAAICAAHAIPLTTIRPRATVGAGRLGIFQILFEWIRAGKNVYVTGDGSNRMQLIHADDLIDFYMLALDRQRPGTYNVGTDRFGTLAVDLATLISEVGSRSHVRGLPVPLAVNALRLLYHTGLSPLVPWHYLTYHRDCYFDIQPLLALGWRPAYSNLGMLRESYLWYCNNAAGTSSDASPHRAPLRQGALRLLKQFS